MLEFFTPEFIEKFLRFCVVGAIGTGIDFGLTAFCKEILKIQKYVSNAIGFSVSATVNYLFNRWWTFRSENSHVAKEYVTFMIVAIIGLGINTLTLYIVSKKFKFGFYFSKVIATGVTIIWNFLANYYITFAKQMI